MADAVPDFQGCLIVTDYVSIWKLDGITGQRYAAYTWDGTSTGVEGALAVHTAGNFFAILYNWDDESYSVIGIDPATGAQKFSVPLEGSASDPIIAGDGYAYVLYSPFREGDDYIMRRQLMLLRVDSNGAYAKTEIKNWASAQGINYAVCASANIITNADQGILLTWSATTNCLVPMLQGGYRPLALQPSDAEEPMWEYGTAIVTGGSGSLRSGPTVPGQDGNVVPVLQAQDGSFVGTVLVWDGNADTPYMVAFDASGNVRWIVPGYGPKIATADGGVIAQAWVPDPYYQFAGPAVTFDQSGNATGQMNLPTYSWLGNAYQVGSVDQVVAAMAPYFALSFWAFEGGNASGNGTAVSNPQYPPLPTCTSSPGCIGPKEGIYNALD